MGKTHTWRMDASSTRATESAPFTSNGTYAAFVRAGSIYVGRLDSCGVFERRCASLRPHVFGLQPIIALSPLSPNLLAISTGIKTSIWDVDDDALHCLIHDTERSVTSSAWSNHDPHVLALGHIDGHVSVWDVRHALQPQHVLSAGTAQCHLLSWSKVSPPILAACCGRALYLYDFNTQSQPETRRYDLDGPPNRLLWQSRTCERIFTSGPDGTIEEWSIEDFKIESPDSDDDLDPDLFGSLEDVTYQTAPLRRYTVHSGKQVLFLGDAAPLILDHHGRKVWLYKDLQSAESGDPIWSDELMNRTEHLAISLDQGRLNIAAINYHDSFPISIPSEACEQLGPVVTENCIKSNPRKHAVEDAPKKTGSSKTMQPITISSLPRKPLKSQKQSWVSRENSRSSPSLRPTTSGSSQPTANKPAVSPRQAMTSSLELPKLYGEESPMPFLSPTIPSRRVSAIPTLSDDIMLPPPENESFGSLPSTATPMNDSDSDDETFDGDALKGSGTLMVPGSANVPLPKSCGAFFSPNGQLVTYFPPKPKAKSTDVDGLSSRHPEERSTKASRLFPVFGNLAVEARDYEESDTESLNSQDDTATHDSPTQELFSFPTQGHGSWSDRLDHMTGLNETDPGQQTVNVSVRDVSDLIHFRPELARKYHVTCDTEEASVHASLANADVARAAGLEDIASIWSLLALLFQDDKLLENLNLADTDVLAVARHASRLVQSASESRPGSAQQSLRLFGGNSSLAKIGASWMVKQIFAWTELRADVQMLASLSAVLLSSAQASRRSDTLYAKASDTQLSAAASDYFVDGASHNSRPFIRSTPVFRADSRDGSFLTQSPAKPTHSSRVSSRNPSQPTTPYIDSLSSTPPFPFPKLSREGSRLSASGSASPEHHRSSFGAAAKFYAQSITDKISSYGTSPPARRFGTSPNNELSSSLPGAAGSWSKSVSFASGVDRGSRSSVRIAPDDDGYDSDRTIEDTSLPHTPKRHTGPVLFTLKNAAAFTPLKEKQPHSHPSSLLSPELAAKARVWIHHYTEQLRRMDMQIQAAELDNIAGVRDSIERQPEHNVLPTPAASIRKTTCSVCYCKIHSVQQMCSQCLHTMHLSCFESLMEDCGTERMECPTGCGCSCALVSYDEVAWDVMEEKAAAPVVRRKMSFTDPRRWRERVQGDSW